MKSRKLFTLSAVSAVILLICSVILLCVCFYRNRHISILAETKSLNPFARVLFVTSTENSFSATLEERGIRNFFSEKNINVNVERYAKDSFTENYADTYILERMRYLEEKNRYDAVIVSGPDACQLVKKRYSKIWKNKIPVFYFDCGSNFEARSLYDFDDFYSFQEDVFINETVDVAVKLFPESRNFFAIYDRSVSGHENWVSFISCAGKYPDIKFDSLNTSFYSRENAGKIIEELPADTVVFFLGASTDVLGKSYAVDEQVEFLLSHTKLPVFSRNADGMGHGMIGGSMLNYESAGEQVAACVLKVLEGQKLSELPIGKLGKGKFCFDYLAAKKRGLQPHLFPEDSIIINFGGEKFFRHTGIFLGSLGVAVSLFCLLVILCLIAMMENRNAKALIASYSQMEYMVGHDFLTRLPNRMKAREMFDKMNVSGKPFSVILFDVDNFKNINDTYSHACGDEVLKTISARLLPIMTDGSFFAARFGGDEFFVLYTDGHLDESSDECQKLISIFSKPVSFEGKKINVNASFGVCNSMETDNVFDEMLSNSDLALYEAKRQGKNKIIFFCDKMKEDLKNANYISKVLEDAIKNNGIDVVYQPQMDAESGKIHGYEALMRLKNIQISPAEFIPVAEETGLISVIDRILTEKVVQQLSLWREHGIPLYKVSINYSYGQIHDTKYVDFLNGLLRQYKIDPSLIGIEITESLFASDKEQIMELLNSFKKIGITLALDDFGTGYSSLSYLTFLPVNVVKIDKSLVDNYLDGNRDIFIKNIVRLVHSLEMKITVEGIEHQWQSDKVKNYHCDYIQGYLYSKPINGEEIEKWMKERIA